MKSILLGLMLLVASLAYAQPWTSYLPENTKESELTFFDYRNAFDQWCRELKIDREGYYINKQGVRQKAYGWKQFKRWEIQVEGTYDGKTGKFRDEVIGREINTYHEKMQASRNIGGNWTSVAYSEEGSGNDGNGRINCVAFHPTDPNTFWVGTAWGGIWSTTDHGATWTPLSDFIKALGIGSIGIPFDYNTSHTIYLGTGDKANIRDLGVGLLKSTNSGVTWQNTGLVTDQPENFYITSILIHPANSSLIYAGSTRGLFRSFDAGASWDTLNLNLIADMEFNPLNPATIYAGTRHTSGDDSTRIIVSYDGGSNWDTVFTVRGNRTELAVSFDDPAVVYGISGAHGGAMKAICKSIDNGQTFSILVDGDIPGNNYTIGCDPDGEGGQSHYDLAIAANPSNADMVFIGGVEAWKSTNGGVSWSLNTDGYNRCSGINSNVHVDQHCQAYQPGTNHFFICSDGGIYYSTNNGSSYTNLSGGLMINQPYRIGCTSDPDEILMGQQDNGIVLYSDGNIDFVGGGDGGTAVIHPYDANRQYFTNNSFGVWGTLNHWSSNFAFSPDNDSSDNWFKPIVVLPPDTVLVGYSDLWKSHNNGQTLFKVHDFNEPGHISDIAVAPSNHNVMVIDFNTHMYKTTDGGDTWEDVTSHWGVEPNSCYHTVFKNDDPDVIWLTDSNWGNGVCVVRSEDGGLTWEDISEGLPEGIWCDIIQNKNQTNYEEIYVCGFFGVWLKLGENPWVPFNNGLPNVVSWDMDAHYSGYSGKLRTGTHGRGVWESDFFSVEAVMPGIWTGTYSSDWHDNRNWQYMEVPTAGENVTIPAGRPHDPHIYLSNANCTNITIESGVVLTISGRTINIAGDALIDGKIKLIGPGANVNVTGDITWEDNSQFELSGSSCSFNVTGDWTFAAGTAINLEGVTCTFAGIASSNLYIHSPNAKFGQLVSNKTSPASLYYNGASTADLVVKNDLVVTSIGKYYHQSDKKLILWGKLDAQGGFYQQNGTCEIWGNDTINLANSASYFNNLFIENSCSVTLVSDIEVRDTLDLMSGVLRVITHELTLGGHLLKENSGLLSFTTGKIVFNGNQEQKIMNDFVFKTVELSKPADTLRILNDLSVEIEKYDWTSGSIVLERGSELLIEDLLDDGIWGAFHVKNVATLNIHNPTGSVDLNGKLRIAGGTVNVYDGNHASYWPGSANAELIMTSGTLDFKNRGIFVLNHPTCTFTENIIGGTIRTVSSFQGDHTSFNPSGGLIELYGGDNAELGHGVGSNFHEVVINKETVVALPGSPENSVSRQDDITVEQGKANRANPGPTRRKVHPPSGSRANKVTVVSNLLINDNLAIESGVFDINGYTVDVGLSLDIYGTLNMLNSSSILNVNSNVTWRAGSSSNITSGFINFKSIWTFADGTNANLGGSNTVKAMGSSLSYIYHKDPGASFAILVVDKTASSLFLDETSAYPLRVSGNLVVKTGNTLQVRSADVVVSGIFNTQSGSTVGILSGGLIDAANASIDNDFSLVNGSSFESANMTVNGSFTLSDGGTLIADDLSLYGGITVNAGSALIHNSIYQAPASTLTVNGGSFILDKAYTGDYMSFSGTTNLFGGIFEISHESVQFNTGAAVSIYGGNLRIGGHFRALAADSFKPDYGAVELINTTGSLIECANGNYFHELIINKGSGAAACQLAYPATVHTNLSILSGELNTMNYTLNVDEDLIIETSGLLTAGSSTINVGEDWTNNRGTSGFAEGTSSVWLVSGQPCQVSAETFYNLDIDKDLPFAQYANMATGSAITVLNKLTAGDGTLRMNNNCTLNLNGDLHLKVGGGLNANAAATGTVINILGDWMDYNPVWSIMVGFASGQSTVYFKGNQAQELTATGGASFYNLVLEKTAESLTPYNNITVVNDFNLVSGQWRQSATGLEFTFKGGFTLSDPALWLDAVNILNFKGESSQALVCNTPGWLTVGSILVQRTAGNGFLNLGSDIHCNSKLKVISGEVELDGYRLICGDSLSVWSGADFSVFNDATIAISEYGSIYVNGGHLMIQGSPGSRATVTHRVSGLFSFLAENGGQIEAAYTDFEYMGQRGLHVDGTGTIVGEQPLLNCSFSNSEAGGALIFLNNGQDLTLHDIVFPANTWSGACNVLKADDAGDVYLPDASGAFAGPFFEDDTYDRVHWPSSGEWEGDVSTEWHNAQNWRYNFQVPDASTDVVIPSGAPNYPVFSQVETTVNSLRLEPSTSLTMTKDSLYVLNYTDIAGQLAMTGAWTALFTDSIVWQSGSSASFNSSAFVNILGNMFIKRGSNLNVTTGIFYFYGDGESRLICHDTAQIGLLRNYKNPPYSLSLVGDTLARLTVYSNFINGTNAILRCPSSQEWVFKGVLSNTSNGHFRCENGTIRLTSGQGNNFKQNTGDFFHNLIIESLIRVNLTGYVDTLRILNDLTILPRAGGTSGIEANNFKILVGGDWINNAGSVALLAETSKVIFIDPSVPQNVQGNTVFNDLTTGVYDNSVINFYGDNSVSNIMEAYTATNVYGNLYANTVYSDNDFAVIKIYYGGNMEIDHFHQGAAVHALGGSLLVNDLAEDYVTGTYSVYNGLLDLGQVYSMDASHDLYYANIRVYGGELRFSGGNGLSLWPRTPGTAIVTMTGGIFDLTNQEVFITTGNFTENISGGLIRTTLSFSADPAATTFHPTGGTVELYGTEDCSFSMPEPSCWFYNLHLSKTDNGGAYPSSDMRVKNEFRMNAGAYMETDGYLITVGP